MSFILDALKKSEQDRQQQASGEFASVPRAIEPSGAPKWILGLAALLIINAVVLVVLLGRDSSPVPGSSVSPAAATAPASASFAERLDEARPPARSAEPAPVVAEVAEAPATANANIVAANASETTRGGAVEPVQQSGEPVEGLPTLSEIRINEGVNLPDLNLDIHVYAASAAQRFVFIDMQKLNEGDLLEAGPRLEEITPDGVVMSYRGMRFVLPRE